VFCFGKYFSELSNLFPMIYCHTELSDPTLVAGSSAVHWFNQCCNHLATSHDNRLVVVKTSIHIAFHEMGLFVIILMDKRGNRGQTRTNTDLATLGMLINIAFSVLSWRDGMQFKHLKAMNDINGLWLAHLRLLLLWKSILSDSEICSAVYSEYKLNFSCKSVQLQN
jgi:hypothetical protein